MLAVLDNESELGVTCSRTRLLTLKNVRHGSASHDKIVGDELDKEKAEKEKMITDVATTVLGVGAGGMLDPVERGSGFVARRTCRRSEAD